MKIEPSLKIIDIEIDKCREKIAETIGEYNRVRNKLHYWRKKKDSLEALAFERKQGQLALLEHEYLTGDKTQEATPA